jgi:subtilisin family serine protease
LVSRIIRLSGPRGRLGPGGRAADDGVVAQLRSRHLERLGERRRGPLPCGGFNFFHNTLGAPADGKKVIAAAAVNSSGRRASFSSVGPSADGRIKPDVAAQGVDVKAASPDSRSGYDEVDGTSFSCPLTAGVVALVLQAHPTYTVDDVISVLKSSASQADNPNSRLGWGLVNAKAALEAPPPGNAVPR